MQINIYVYIAQGAGTRQLPGVVMVFPYVVNIAIFFVDSAWIWGFSSKCGLFYLQYPPAISGFFIDSRI